MLAAMGALELAVLATLGWWDGATFPVIGIVLFVAAFSAYAFAAGHVLETQGGLVTIWIVAVLMRLVMLPLAPELSGDIYRFLWDGEVQLAGINPYRFAPNALELSHVHTSSQALISDLNAHSLSPPLAQVFFLAIAAVGGAVFQAKLLWIGFDLGTGWLLGRISSITGRSRRLTQLLYLWSPLLVIEVAWNGHFVSVGLFALALIVLLARAPAGAGAATGVAALVGFVPALALPSITRRLGSKYFVGFVVAAGVLIAPYATASGEYLASLVAFVDGWSFMRGPYALFEAALPSVMAARYAVAGLLLFIMGWTIFQRYRPERSLLWIIGSCLILSPGVQPWYFLWVLPLAALRANGTWLLMTGLGFLGYAGFAEYQNTGAWAQPLWARLMLWVPFLVILGLDSARLWKERVPPAKSLSEPV